MGSSDPYCRVGDNHVRNTLPQTHSIFFIAGAILINVPYTLLIVNFDYPGILRQPTAENFTRFHAGDDALIDTWLAFAWVGLPILPGAVMLKRVLEEEDSPFLETAAALGVIGFVMQLIGLLRWVFVVAVLARLFTDPGTDPATQALIPVVFIALHQYGGDVLGEHLRHIFTIVWMGLISGIIYQSKMFGKWVAWIGWFASAVYLLAQTESFAAAIPNFPMIGWAELHGSLLRLVWMLVLGIYLVK